MNNSTSHSTNPRALVSVEQQDAHLRSDVARVRALYHHIAQAAPCDQTRLLGIVCATNGAERYLAYTIPRIIEQVQMSGNAADIIIGLNNGFICERTAAYLATLPNTQCIHLFTETKPSETTPAASYDTPDLLAPAYTLPTNEDKRNRVLLVHQRQSPYAAGKIRMLDDIVRGLLIPSIAQGWAPPKYTLVFDAETIFFCDPQDRSLARELEKVTFLLEKYAGDLERVIAILIQLATAMRQPSPPLPTSTPPPERLSSGLDHLIGALDRDPQLTIISALTRFCIYRSTHTIANLAIDLPDLDLVCSPLHAIYNVTCGLLPGCLCMAGGGTLGHTAPMISLLGTIVERYPGTTSEDSILTVLAAPAGFRMQMAEHVFLTNRCPALDDMTTHTPPRAAWKQQFSRWYAGFDAVEQHYGTHHVTDILGPSSELFVAASLAVFFKTLRRTADLAGSMALLRRFLESGTAYEEIRHMAQQNPDTLTGSGGKPAW